MPDDQTTDDVIACGRCGRENRGVHAIWGNNGNTCMAPGSWEEDGWVCFTPAIVKPFIDRAIYRLSVEPQFVCPRCLCDEERPPDESCVMIVCARCGRENRGRLDEYSRYRVAEWEETGWIEYHPATVEALDGAGASASATQRSSRVCLGCLTAEERAQLDAIVWVEGGPAE